MLSKTIVQYFVENLTLDELRKFNREVLIPQKAKCLQEHLVAAENILLQQKTLPVHKDAQEIESRKAALT
jgi:hypothetical protein